MMEPVKTELEVPGNLSSMRPVLDESLNRVFVYGTLKQGFSNWGHFLSKARHLGMARTEGIMFHVGGFPALSFEEHFSPILGEVYEVDDRTLENLDRLEGIPNHYNRIKIRMQPYGEVFTYIYPHRRVVTQNWVIPTGNWQGEGSAKLKWLGLGRGVLIGDPDNPTELYTTLVDPKYILRPDPDGKCYLVDRSTGIVIGTYVNVSEFLTTRMNGVKNKPRISLVKEQQSPSLPGPLQTRPLPDFLKNQPVGGLPTVIPQEPPKPKPVLIGPGVRMA